MEQHAHGWQFWIDRGGTFTDVIGVAPDGVFHTRKLLSVNPGRYADAAVEGVRGLLGLSGDEPLPKGAVRAIKMGTTVATNALLEHRGEPTVWVTNAGFADLLRIGTQSRPDVFARDIKLPDPLYKDIIEITGRLAADGEELVPLDEVAAFASLQRAVHAGITSCAIALMHGYRFPQHETRVAALAREAGMRHVSVSSLVSPVIRLVSRGDTTVVDSYLSPVLRRYVDALREPLRGAPLWFMQSHGGLIQADQFLGKDSILSGPAGGIVGAVESCKRVGLSRIIAFDMGGTSTDVALYAGAFERTESTDIAGIHLRVPMLDIHTVAAGGGSVAQYALGRYQVGPLSAGADPGPAAYRRGGPLTVTDCNVILGRVQPRFFPSVFGVDGSAPLDEEAALHACGDVRRALPDPETPPEQVAWGFLRVAVDNMANAIKHVSLKRGHDAADYALCCFGGAGGQHACLVADALGMNNIYVPPYAGLLSALGMGLAAVRVVEEQTVHCALDAEDALAHEGEGHRDASHNLEVARTALTQRVTERMREQGVADNDIVMRILVAVRYKGQDTSLRVPLGALKDMMAAFTVAHQERFGFMMQKQPCVVVGVQVEASTQLDTVAPAVGESHNVQPMNVRMFDGKSFVEARAFASASMVADDACDGPALVYDTHAITVVERGWRATRDALGGLRLTRSIPRPKTTAVGTHADPVQLEIFGNLFMAIAERMGIVLRSTALSVNIKERLDFSCAIFDPDGGLVANAPHVPVHLGSMGDSVAAIHATHRATMKAGHAYVTNAPYHGGTHLPDITVVSPVFDKHDELLFYVACRGHHADVGGITPGSMPAHSKHIDEEGALLDGFLLVQDGELREDALTKALRAGAYPARNVAQNIGDLKAQLAANAAGARELLAMLAHYGIDTVHAYMQHVQDNAEAAVREVIDSLHDGEFACDMDDGSHIQVAVRVHRKKRRLTVDFTGTSPVRTNNLNAPRSICTAVVLYVFRTLVNQAIPLNAGCLKPITIIVPKHSMLDPDYPAPVVAGNVETSQVMADALYGALGVLAASQGTMNNLTFGNDQLQYYETLCGGAGASADYAGASGVHTHMTNSRLTDPEILETRFPVRVEHFGLRRNSGGVGFRDGGDGVTRAIRFLEPMRVSILSNRRRVAPHGLQGGKDGARGRNTLIGANGRRDALKPSVEIDVRPGDMVLVETPGGGAFGERDKAKV